MKESGSKSAVVTMATTASQNGAVVMVADLGSAWA